jgi:hypothetical protein
MGQRYGAVLLLMLTLVVFSILSANGAWTRALAFAVECGALLVLIETSRESPKVRRLGAGFGALALVLVSLVLTDVLSPAVVFSVQFAVGIVLLFLLVRGLVRIVKTHGVTLQVVAGALGVYLLLGMLFGWLIRVVAVVGSGDYFATGGDVSTPEAVYFSFTVLTTTGFGDFAPAMAVGRALAVLEMLVGQIYLVTVIGVIVGDLSGSRRLSRQTAKGDG